MTGWPPVSRCGPLSILAVTLLALVGSLWIHDLRVGLVAVGVQLGLAPLAFRPDPATLVRLGVAVLAGLTVAWSAWLLGEPRSAQTAATAFLRIVFFTLPGALLLGHVEATVLGDHLAQRLHLPARPVVASVASLGRLGDLAADWRSLERARRVRGLGARRSPVGLVRQSGALTFGLLVSGLRRAARMAEAMDARGFATTGRHRTWAEPAPWHRGDTVLLALGLATSGIPLILTSLS
ncbi:MAG TPA: energy-coupling factor transporter transmembrane component T [Dermatophilaceae bacterium]|nr:energy-coupling factor transporter transmembrane component T [Dermatophilaceae bacterium]